ncbi:pectinesterase family protein [uncultured Prevotella sp.]|uniref:pectinesterase family protein n=1 Tax=uncultured Prevotella sp. TaxID=159272 RepID=UPI0025D215E7|nr:pectinesterase family protein [uncultured Prevotella sp.]
MMHLKQFLLCFLSFLAASAEAQIVVEAGNAESLLQAIEQANKQNADATSKRLFILVPNGVYDLGKRTLTAITGHRIALVGESMEGTVIVNAPDVEDEGISKTATLLNQGRETYVQDLTLKNALDYYHSGAVGRAVCWQDKGDRTMMKRVRMLSYQDTYYSNNEQGRSYFEAAEIHGTIDFICGAGDVFFNHCLLVTEKRRTEGGGRDIIAAPRTSKTAWGYVFSHCTIRNDDSEFLYARGWREHPRCVWLYTTLETPEMLQPTRFEPKGMRTIQNDFYEYGTTDGEGRDITPRSNVVTFTLNGESHAVETILTEQQAAKYTLKNVFPDWQPQKNVRQLEKQGGRLKRKLLKE